ncbi:MAG: YggU family protein [Verrucomicrobiales bacterium]|nr:YggU family protein [Verrucomicrobiales bacterium]
MSLPKYIRPHESGVYLAVKVQPRASKNEIGEALGDELKIKVTAPPVDAAANQAVVELLADKLDCSRGNIQIVRGQTSRHKTLFISGKTANELSRLLQG